MKGLMIDMGNSVHDHGPIADKNMKGLMIGKGTSLVDHGPTGAQVETPKVGKRKPNTKTWGQGIYVTMQPMPMLWNGFNHHRQVLLRLQTMLQMEKTLVVLLHLLTMLRMEKMLVGRRRRKINNLWRRKHTLTCGRLLWVCDSCSPSKL